MRLESDGDDFEQLIEGGAFANGDVKDFVRCGQVYCASSEEVCLHHIFDEAEVAAGFAVAVDVDRLFLEECVDPFGDDGGVSTIGILTWSEDVEVAEADGRERVCASENVGI